MKRSVKSRILLSSLVVTTFLSIVQNACADMGQIHASDAAIREDSQKAIILHNGTEEVLIHGTFLKGDRKTGELEQRSHDAPARQDPRCALRPDPGPCKGLFEKFYFDRAQGVCKEFFYGGCQGVVPFDTMEECAAICLGGQEHSEHRDGEKSR